MSYSTYYQGPRASVGAAAQHARAADSLVGFASSLAADAQAVRPRKYQSGWFAIGLIRRSGG